MSFGTLTKANVFVWGWWFTFVCFSDLSLFPWLSGPPVGGPLSIPMAIGIEFVIQQNISYFGLSKFYGD